MCKRTGLSQPPLLKDPLPLSWKRSGAKTPQLNIVKLPRSRYHWVTLGTVPDSATLGDIIERLDDTLGTRYLIRGLSAASAKWLGHRGFKKLRTGSEAVIDLQKGFLPSRSLSALSARGNAQGTVKEIEYSEHSRQKLQKLLDNTPRAKKPALKHLYDTDYSIHLRCFVLEHDSGKWLGAVTTSSPEPSRVHTELILRHRRARVGVMEALFTHVIKTAEYEGVGELSLGEVPFVNTSTHNNSVKEVSLALLGRVLGFGFKSRGLYEFKNKFHPVWQPVYMCGKPRIPWRSLVDIYFVTGLGSLAVNEATSKTASFRKNFISSLERVAIGPLNKGT